MEFDLTPKQSKVFRLLLDKQPKRFLACGGTRSGKTFLIRLAIMMVAEEYHQNCKILIARKELKSARNTIFKDIEPIADHFGWRVYSRRTSPVIEGDKGQQIVIAGMDNPSSFMGDEFTIIFLNEITHMTYNDYKSMITRSNRKSFNDEGRQFRPAIWADCNPSHRKHWVRMLAIKGVNPVDHKKKINKKNRWIVTNWTPFENPHNDEEYLEGLDELDEIEKKRMKEGLWVNKTGVVYPEFNEKRHTFNDENYPNGFNEFSDLETVDFGFNDPFVWGRCKKIDGVYWFYPPYIHRSKRIVKRHAKKIKLYRKVNIDDDRSDLKEYSDREGVKPLFCVSDHSRDERGTLHDSGITTVPANKSFIRGMNEVKRCFDENRIMIHESMSEFIEELHEYKWPDEKDNRNSDERPIDKDNHFPDALRYLIMKDLGIEPEYKKKKQKGEYTRIGDRIF